MIIYDSDKNAVFGPHSLNFEKEYKKAVMVFDDEVWEDCVEKDDALEFFPARNVQGKVFDSFRIYMHNNEEIVWLYPNTGAASVVMDLELLIASGVNKIVAFGTCGAMDKKVAKNSIIIPISAVREEGVSYHYLPPGDEVAQNNRSVDIMSSILSQRGIDYLSGKVWTTDAVYRETAQKIQTMQEKGCIAVDMEMAALFAVAEFRGINLAGFLIAEDNIVGGYQTEQVRDSAQLFQLAIDIVESL